MLTKITIAACAACLLGTACFAPAIAKDRTTHQGTKAHGTVSRAASQSFGAVLPNERLAEPSYMAIQSKGYRENN